MDTLLAYPIPADEVQRLRELERYGVIGSASDEHLERIVELAGLIFSVPISVISLVEKDRQWFLSRRGLEAQETPRDQAFCAHAIVGEDVMVVPDALEDPRFQSNPLVTDPPHIRFYAGAPLCTPDGHNLGTLCVIDRQPRQPSERQLRQLTLLAELVMREIELRRLARLCPVTGLPTRQTFLSIAESEIALARQQGHPLSLLCIDIDNLRMINNRWGHAAGDRLLRDLVQLLQHTLRPQDYAARLGDGEFALLLVGMGSQEALALAERLRQAVSHLQGAHSQSDFSLHISGGLTGLSAADHHSDSLLSRAERALDLAKRNGRNQIASLFGNS